MFNFMICLERVFIFILGLSEDRSIIGTRISQKETDLNDWYTRISLWTYWNERVSGPPKNL